MRRALHAAFWTCCLLLSLYTLQAGVMLLWTLKSRLPPPPKGDERTAEEVRQALGAGASLHFSPAFLVGRGWEGVFPLGGQSRRTVVHCNEYGTWLTYPSDEHGFNNSRGAHKKAEAVVIGDSFAEGSCVRQGEDVASRLGALNLGIGGIGPLLELAILKEYALPLRPKRVYWLYYASDMNDLRAELADPRLADYKEQGLRGRQKEADAAWDRFEARAKLEGWTPSAGVLESLPAWRRAARFLAFHYLRGYPLSREDEALLSRYASILEEARRLSGGDFVWVYLPERQSYVAPRRADRFKARLLAELRGRGFKVVDATPYLSLDAFWLKRSTHYTADGYRRLAEAIQTEAPVESAAKPPRTTRQ